MLGGLWVGYRNLVSKPRHEKAAELLAQAQNKFEADDADYTVALNGDDNGAGFLEVIERYGSTPQVIWPSTMPASATSKRAI